MADPINREFIAAQLRNILEEQRTTREEQRALSNEQRRISEAIAGLSRSIDHIRDDLSTTLKDELGGLFANLETRLERRIAAEIREQLAHS